MSITKAKLFEHLLGGCIFRMMSRSQTLCTDHLKRKGNHCAGSLRCQPLAPILWPQMKSQFVNPILRPVRPEPAASHMFVVGQRIYRPVLKTVGVHPADFAPQSLPNFFVGKRSPEETGHFNVSPKLARRSQVLFRPPPESNPLRLQKIRLVGYAFHRNVSCMWVEAISKPRFGSPKLLILKAVKWVLKPALGT